MTTDTRSLVERLRDIHPKDSGYAEICNDAAAEIERLTAALASEREECAKVAEKRAEEYRTGPFNSVILDKMTHEERCEDYAIACETVAAAIRERGK